MTALATRFTASVRVVALGAVLAAGLVASASAATKIQRVVSPLDRELP